MTPVEVIAAIFGAVGAATVATFAAVHERKKRRRSTRPPPPPPALSFPGTESIAGIDDTGRFRLERPLRFERQVIDLLAQILNELADARGEGHRNHIFREQVARMQGTVDSIAARGEAERVEISRRLDGIVRKLDELTRERQQARRS